MLSGKSVNAPGWPVAGEQLALSVRDGLGVETPDPAHDQPGADVVGFTAGRERREGNLGDFGIRDQALFVFVPDRVQVVAATTGTEIGWRRSRPTRSIL